MLLLECDPLALIHTPLIPAEAGIQTGPPLSRGGADYDVIVVKFAYATGTGGWNTASILLLSVSALNGLTM